MLFVETPIFTRLVAAELRDSEYGALQQAIADAPEAGRLIRGGAGIRKLRWAATGVGKSGGFRVIYFWRTAEDQVFLLYLFAKSERADLTRLQIKRLAEAARELK